MNITYADIVKAWNEIAMKSYYLSESESERFLEELIAIIKRNKNENK